MTAQLPYFGKSNSDLMLSQSPPQLTPFKISSRLHRNRIERQVESRSSPVDARIRRYAISQVRALICGRTLAGNVPIGWLHAACMQHVCSALDDTPGDG